MQNNSFVLDTNIWISAIITNSEKSLFNYIEENKLQIYICPEMINEIEDVLSRKKIKKYLIYSVIESVTSINFYCKNIQIAKRYNQAPDKDDNYLYDLCIETKSQLVTGDKLLLSYISNPPITTISRFDFLSLFYK
jgi:putative PIN family toxin of toxin-antitoxin system